MADYRIDVKIDPSGARRGSRAVKDELQGIESTADRTRNSLARMIPAAAIGAALGKMTNDALKFGDAMAEVSTLIDEATFDLGAMEQAALDQAAAFGSMPTQQASAAYQIISSGASSAAEATDTLTAANKLAVGGVTDVATAADGLTSVLNAYGDKVASATDVSDTLFVGMRAGKTTIDQLSRSLGKVAPLAATAGVDFDQLVAATSALTKGGISTTESVTGLRAILAAVAKPTSEASKMAEKLGLDFSAAALQSKGFAGFLDEIVQKTGGSSDAMAQLFGGVEALVPALALAGQAGQDFDAIMLQMADRAGQTDEAFGKIADGDAFKFRQFLSQLAVEGIKLGNVILSVLVPALTFVSSNLETMKAVVVGAGAAWVTYRALTLLAAAGNTALMASIRLVGGTVASVASQVGVMAAAKVAATAAAAGLTAGIRALTAAMLANPVTLIATAIGVLVSVLYMSASASDDAADAAMKKAEADRLAAEESAERARITGELVGMTVAERAETINAMRAAYAKAVGDQQATYQALKRAQAERELAAALASQAIQKEQKSRGTLTRDRYGPRGMSEEVSGAVGAASVASAREKELQARFDREEAEAARLSRLLNDAENQQRNLEAPDVPTVSVPDLSGRTAALKGETKAAEEARTTFAEIEAQLAREIELSKLVGVARDVRSEQFRAEDALGRDLTDTEKARVDQMIREADANQQRADAQRAYQDGLSDALSDLQRDNVLLRTNIDHRGERAFLMDLEARIGQRLAPQDAERVRSLYRENEALDEQNRLYERLTGNSADIIRERETLNALYEQGRIGIEEYNRALYDLRLDEIDDKIRNGSASMAEGFISELARMSEAARNWKASAGTIFGQFFDQFSKGVGDSIGRAIVYSEDLGQSLKEVARGAVSSLISSLVQLGIQILINKAIMLAFGNQSTATAGAQAAALASAWAPAAALASLATLGTNATAAIGGVALTLASTKAMSAVASGFQEGGYTGNGAVDEAAGIVHGQEFVVNAPATRKHRSMLEAINAGRDPTPTARGTQATSGGSGGGNTSVSVGQIAVTMQSSGDARQDGEIAGERIREIVLEIVHDDYSKQSRGGGAFTQTRSSTMSG